MEDLQARRLAQNETIFRQVNEYVRAAEEQMRHDDPRFICECADIDCSAQIAVTLDEYRTIRTNAARFLVASGHVDERIERVVDGGRGYQVVEKVGPGRDVAEKDAGA